MIMKSHTSSFAARWLSAAVLATGFGTAWFALASMLLGLALEPELVSRPEFITVTVDGTPYITSSDDTSRSRLKARDLKGGLSRDLGDLRKDVGGFMPRSGWNDLLAGVQPDAGALFSPPRWAHRIKAYRPDRGPDVIWYFVHDGEAKGSGYFVGYGFPDNRLVGFIGLGGFRERRLRPEERIPVLGEVARAGGLWSSLPSTPSWINRAVQFQDDDRPPPLVYIPSGNVLRSVDLASRTIADMFEAPSPIVSVAAPSFISIDGKRLIRPLLVRTEDAIYKFDRHDNLRATISLPAEVDRRASIQWYELEDGRAVAVVAPTAAGGRSGDGFAKWKVYRIEASGAIASSTEVSLRVAGRHPGRWEDVVGMAAALPSPAALAATGARFAQTADGPAIRERFLPALAGATVLSAVLAAAAWRRARRFGASGRDGAAWAAFTALFGLPAFAGFLLHRRWPTLSPCPHCRAPLARDRDVCTRCGTPVAAPALQGIEIFA